VSKTKAKLNHAEQALWDVAIRLLRLMGYRLEKFSYDANAEYEFLAELVFVHKNEKHSPMKDLLRLDEFLFDVYGYTPYTYKTDSRARRLVLRKGLRARPTVSTKPRPRRSIIV